MGTANGDAPTQANCTTSYAVDNGNPTVTCGANPAPCLPCDVGSLTSTNQTVCPGQTAILILDGVPSSSADFSLGFNDAMGGTGGLAGGFTIVGISAGDFPYEFDEDINGILSANSLDVLVGQWVITVYATQADDVHCDSTTTIIVDFVDASHPDCITVGINETEAGSAMVYPNPSDGRFTIEFSEMESNVELTILDMSGRLVYAENMNGNSGIRKEYDLGLASGSYMLRIASEKRVETMRLILK